MTPIHLSNLDRQPILINWVDNIVVPSYELFKADLDDVEHETADAFVAEPDMAVINASCAFHG